MKNIQYLDNLSKKNLKLLPNVNSSLDKIGSKRWRNIIKILEKEATAPLENTQFIYHTITSGVKYQNVLECTPMGDRYKFDFTPIGMIDNSKSKRLTLSVSIKVTISKTVFVKDLQDERNDAN